MITKAQKYRIYPNKTQEALLVKTFGCARFVWNYNVEIFNGFDKNKTDNTGPKSVSELRKDYAWLTDVSATALNQKARDFFKFKQAYFSKNRKGKRIGRPKFKSKFGKQSYRLTNQKFALLDDFIRIEKIGKVKLVKDRGIPNGSKILSVTISKNCAGHYFASVLFETEVAMKPKTGRRIGIDVGLKMFLTGSDGTTIENPRFFRESQAKLARLQRNLSRKQKGSSRREKARLKVAKFYNTVVNRRMDFIHNITSHLVNEYDFIAVEDLNVAGMVKNRKLAKSISDASFAEFYRVLSYKASWYGKEVIKVDRWFASSKTCCCCGWKNESLTLSDRTFVCQECGLELDRDKNASANILNEALRVSSAIRTQSGCQTFEGSLSEAIRDEAFRAE